MHGTIIKLPPLLDLPHGAKLYPLSLELPDNLTIKEWGEIGVFLIQTGNAVQWALGDWWCSGSHRYGERKAKAQTKGIPYTFESLMTYGWVARSVPPSIRHRGLSFSHHMLIARYSADPELQQKFLKRAARLKWSVSKLSEQLYEHKLRNPLLGYDSYEQRVYSLAFGWLWNLKRKAEQTANPLNPSMYLHEPYLDWCSVGDVEDLGRAAAAAADAWASHAKTIKTYLANRQAQGDAFVPCRIEIEAWEFTGNTSEDPEAESAEVETGPAEVPNAPGSLLSLGATTGILESRRLRILTVALPQSPTTIADVALAQEIRAHAKAQKSPYSFAKQMMSDARTLGAILTAPNYLSGLSDVEWNGLRKYARETFYPQQCQLQKQLNEARDDLVEGVAATKRMVKERCQLSDPDPITLARAEKAERAQKTTAEDRV